MTPQTAQALNQALVAGDKDKIAVIRRYLEDSWDYAGYPYPGPAWMKGRYRTWENYRDYLVELDRVTREMAAERAAR